MLSRSVLRAGVAVVFSVSLPTIAGAETLKQALTAAYENNPVLSSALYNVKATAENVGLAASATRPKIGAGASIEDKFGTSAPPPGSGAFNTLGPLTLGFSYNQTLFDNNKTDAKVKQAKAATEATLQNLRATEQQVLLAVVTAYMNVIQYTQLVALRADNVKFYQTQVKSAQDRLNLGEGTKIDVSQAQASLASGQAQYEAARASLQTFEATYEQWVGHKPRNLTNAYRLNGLVPATLEEALASADERHPSILAAKAGIAAAQFASDAAEAAFGPELDATGQVGTQFPNTGPGTTTSGIAGSLKLSLSLPLYSGGALSASARQANMNAIKSDLDAQAARASVHQQVVAAWATLQNSNAQISSAQAAVNAGQLALEGVIQERDVGQATTLDVLNAQATVTTAKEQLISANAGKVIATFTLIANEGRLSARDLALPVEIKSPEGYMVKAADVWQELRSLE